MRRLCWTLALIALIAVAVGCGSSDTKTVTETVAAKAPEEAEPAEESAREEAGSVPTETTIPDGTWKQGEYTPGTYRAHGGPECEWEQRQDLNKEANGPGQWGIGDTNILAEIDAPYFLTAECGIWKKVE